ncbi:Disease resistance protein RPS6 [Cardamine amara subsp. amara]|uniref:Disease resistance protein RPS6 n=1 Tax=Cardamine amara subsp. amara TaxID=228776 RepID=A0ABD1AI00_CARAN
MGKKIVRTQSVEPGNREFLIDSTDICDVLYDSTGTKKVLGIALNIDEIDELHVHERSFQRMSNLRFLKIYTDQWSRPWSLPNDFNYLPPKLRLLSWYKYPMRFMPFNFRPENLVKLQMRESKLEKLWEGVRSLTCLKDMDLSRSENLKEIPNLSMATNLETLDLNCCSSLVEIPSSIRNLNRYIDKVEHVKMHKSNDSSNWNQPQIS